MNMSGSIKENTMEEDGKLLLIDACINGYTHLGGTIDDSVFIRAWNDAFLLRKWKEGFELEIDHPLPSKSHRIKYMENMLSVRDLLALYTCICSEMFR